MIEFVFMLTRDDVTIDDARDVLGGLRDSGLRYVGFKDVGPAPAVLRDVAADAHEAGMEVMLEVVSTSADDEARSIGAASTGCWAEPTRSAALRSWPAAGFATARSPGPWRAIRAS